MQLGFGMEAENAQFPSNQADLGDQVLDGPVQVVRGDFAPVR